MKYEGRCDVCEHGDNRWGHVLQKCSDCGVLVHEACYGLDQNSPDKDEHGKRKNWVCRACELKELQPDGKRPTRCVLCCVSGGVHAMHPIYDKEGPDGKQVQRPSGPAWAHTLCCMFIGSHRKTEGCVFACNERGLYDGAEEYMAQMERESMESSSTSASSSDNKAQPQQQKDDPVEAHHFVICRAGLPSHSAHYELLKSYRKEVRCATCHLKDNNAKVLRVSVQCCNGDEEEQIFKKCHSVRNYCSTGQHVGCARWKVDTRTGLPPQHPRVFFWPGALDVDDEDIEGPMARPIAEIYCGVCAADIENHRSKELGITKSPEKKRKSVDATSGTGLTSAEKEKLASVKKKKRSSVVEQKEKNKKSVSPSKTKKKNTDLLSATKAKVEVAKEEDDELEEPVITPHKKRKRISIIEDDSDSDNSDPNAIDL